MKLERVNRPITNMLAVTMFMCFAFTAVAECGGMAEYKEQSVKSIVSKATLGSKIGFSKDSVDSLVQNNVQRAFDTLSRKWGGKIVWSMVLDVLAERFSFKRPNHVYFSIDEVWNVFIEKNQENIERGNCIIRGARNRSDWHGELNGDEMRALIGILKQDIEFPEELEILIEDKITPLWGRLIVRSSAYGEDGFQQNLAGVLTSMEVDSQGGVSRAVEQIFYDALEQLWFTQNSSAAIDGLPYLVEQPFGIGLEVDEFQDYEASGTALSSIAGHSSLQMVVGDASLAVNPNYPVTTRYVFPKKATHADEGNVYPSYPQVPYEFRLHGESYSVDSSHLSDLAKVCEGFPRHGSAIIPATVEQAFQAQTIFNHIEQYAGEVLLSLIGVEGGNVESIEFDGEFGFNDGVFFIHQIRPDVGYENTPPVESSSVLQKKTPIAETGLSIGATTEEGITLPVVYVERGIRAEDADAAIAEFEKYYSGPYIRVQRDIASRVLYSDTNAVVLIDPESGSEQAHNVNLVRSIYKKKDKKFIYAGIPNCKNEILEAVGFRPHNKVPHLWVSSTDLTYFSNGIVGSFYAADTCSVEPLLNNRVLKIEDTLAVIEAYTQSNDLFHAGISEHSVLDKAIKPLLKELGLYYNDEVADVFSVLMDESVEATLAYMKERYDVSKVLFEIESCIESLKKYFRNPLLPSSYENDLVRSVEWFFGQVKNLVEQAYDNPQGLTAQGASAERKKSEVSDTFNILYVQDQVGLSNAALNLFRRKLGSEKRIRVEHVVYLTEAIECLRTKQYDFVIFDVSLPAYPDQMVMQDELDALQGEFYQLIQTVKRKAMWSMASKAQLAELGVPDRLLRVLDNRWQRVSPTDVIDTIQRYFDEWQEEREVEQIRKEINKVPVEELGETFNVLYVQDDAVVARTVLETFQIKFASNPMMRVSYAGCMSDAIELMEKKNYDYILFDVVIPDVWNGGDHPDCNPEMRQKYYRGIENIPFKALCSLLGGEGLSDYGVPLSLRRSLDASFEVDSIEGPIQTIRSEFAAWEENREVATVLEGPGVKSEAESDATFNVLYVQDDFLAAKTVVSKFKKAFSADTKFAARSVACLSEAIDAMKTKKYEYVIFDLSVPSHPDNNSYGPALQEMRDSFYEQLELVPHKAVLSNAQKESYWEYGMADDFIGMLEACWESMAKFPLVVDSLRDVFDEWKEELKASGSRPFRVMVLDDSRIQSEALRAGLDYDLVKNGTCELTHVVSFTEGARELRKHAYDVVVIDCVAPGNREAFMDELDDVPFLYLYSNMFGVNLNEVLPRRIRERIRNSEFFNSLLIEEDIIKLYHEQEERNTEEVSKQEFRILLMNDNPQQRQRTRIGLDAVFGNNENYVIDEVDGYDRAYYSLESNEYDVVIFDVMAPGMPENKKAFFDIAEKLFGVFVMTGCDEDEIEANVPKNVFDRIDGNFDGWNLSVDVHQKYLDREEEKRMLIGAHAPQKTGFRVLVLEDDPRTCKSNVERIQKEFINVSNVEVVSAEDYRVGCEALKSGAFDVVVMDVDLDTSSEGMYFKKGAFYDLLKNVPNIVVCSGMSVAYASVYFEPHLHKKIKGWNHLVPEKSVKNVWLDMFAGGEHLSQDVDVCVVSSDTDRMPALVDIVEENVGSVCTVVGCSTFKEGLRVVANNQVRCIIVDSNLSDSREEMTAFVATARVKNANVHYLRISENENTNSSRYTLEANEYFFRKSPFYVPKLKMYLERFLSFLSGGESAVVLKSA